MHEWSKMLEHIHAIAFITIVTHPLLDYLTTSVNNGSVPVAAWKSACHRHS